MIKRFSYLLAICLTLAPAVPVRSADPDHYLLALSWSPSWCAGDPDRSTHRQCAPERDLGFILHSLWPQYADGDWPEYCDTPHRDASRAQTAAMADIMGDAGLAWYQWKKHGRCSGLSAEDYFAAARFAFSLIDRPDPAPGATPDALAQAFLRANPDLTHDAMIVTCRGERIQDVRICLTRNLGPRPCSRGVLEDACRHSRPLDVPEPP